MACLRLVDYWDVNVGPSRTHPENHQKPYVAGVKEFTAKPVVNVGRFTSLDTMVAVLAAGQCDIIIGGARPSFADPFLPRKINE
jgi:dimethylamine/trimethylamine dehydrogenase